MHIECPSCSTNNKIEFGENIICHKCKKSFAGHVYKQVKKPVTAAALALAVGVFGTYKVDQVFFQDHRYPTSVEYEIINACINSSRIIKNSAQYAYKTDLCICALEKTMERVGYKEIGQRESEFKTLFQKNVYNCS